MADKHQREIAIDDKKLFDLVSKKGELVEQGRAASRLMEDLQKQMDRVTDQMSGIADGVNVTKRSIIDRAQKLAKTLLSEYEIPVTTEIRDGKLYLLVTDAMSEFKDTFQSFDKWREPVPRKKKN